MSNFYISVGVTLIKLYLNIILRVSLAMLKLSFLWHGLHIWLSQAFWLTVSILQDLQVYMAGMIRKLMLLSLIWYLIM